MASFRDKISFTFFFHGVESPKARLIAAGQDWAGLKLRAEVKVTAAAWAPFSRLPPESPSSQSPHPRGCRAALASTVITYGYLNLSYVNIQFPAAIATFPGLNSHRC